MIKKLRWNNAVNVWRKKMERKFRHAKLRVTLGKGGLEFLLEERHLLQSPPRIRLFQFRVISTGTRVTELWTLPKATKLTYFRPLLSYSREWKAQELWLARITKGEKIWNRPTKRVWASHRLYFTTPRVFEFEERKKVMEDKEGENYVWRENYVLGLGKLRSDLQVFLRFCRFCGISVGTRTF